MNYMGRMRDVMTLAHELGHGAHASLSREQSLLNFHGTLPLAELASTFGEMLVFEKVQARATLKERLAMYDEKIDDSFATIPRQTALYRFESAIHEHRRTKGELSPEDFGEHWQREIQTMFGDSVTLGDEHKIWWSYIGHFVGSPFYVYAYSFGELLALSLYRQSQTGGREFAEKYTNMLRCGGSMGPHDLVAQVGVDLDDPAFWQGGFDVLGSLVTRFEELWAEYKQTL
jgi:oligoendopeptidase F